MLRKAIEKQQVQALLNAYIIGFALCESAAIFGLMDHFVTGSGYCRFGFILAAIGMLLHFPKKEHCARCHTNSFDLAVARYVWGEQPRRLLEEEMLVT